MAVASDLYLWTESTTFGGIPVTAIKYQTGSHNLAGVCFKVNIVSGNFPAVEDSGNVYQLSDCVDQAKQGTNFPGAHADIYRAGELGNKWELCSGNAATGIVTLAGTVGLSSSSTNTNVLAYLYGGSYTINEIYSASDSSAQSYTAKDWTYQVGNPNSAPTEITFTPESALTAGHTGKVGTLYTEDANDGDTHTYTITTTSGGTHASLEIGGANSDEVHVKSGVTIEAQEYTFKITTDDGNGGTFSEDFTVTFSAAGGGGGGEVTQTITLVKGWTWSCFYVDLTDTTLLDLSVNNLGGSLIKAKVGNPASASYYETANYTGWYPTGLDSIVWKNGISFQINNPNDITASISLTRSVPSTINLNVVPGWNWIGFINTEEKTIVDVLPNGKAGYFIKRKAGNPAVSTYYVTANYTGWYPTNLAILPGEGYQFSTEISESITLSN